MLTSATTEKDVTPDDVIEATTKNRKNNAIGLEKISDMVDGRAAPSALSSASACSPAPWFSSLRMPPWASNNAAAAMAISPVTSIASRQSKVAVKKMMVAGATAPPRWPKKVCKPNALPMRSPAMEELRMA